MKSYLNIFLILVLFTISCKPIQDNTSLENEPEDSLVKDDTYIINSEENTYEIIIIDPNFSTWLNGNARPRHYYTQQFMEGRNALYVTEWNQRVNQPQRFSPELYQLAIDYDRNEDYGYEINYQLYNYFIYFQLKYNQKLGPFVPKI